MRTLMTTTLFAATFIALSLQAGTRPPAVQSGPYSWSTGTYQYDAAGNIIAIGTHTFAYDALSRLSSSHVTAPGAVSNQTFTYDAFGNMIERTTSDVPTAIAADPTTNHLDPSIALAYDDAGEITQFHPPGSASTYGFTYDALGSVTAETVGGVTTSYFVYTADDERLRTENPVSNKKHWRVRNLDNKVLRDVLLSGSTASVYRDYLYRGGALLEAITPTTVEHFSLDHLGSPRLISDVVGNQISLHTYLPFGEEAGPSAADGEPMKFTGHERDDDPAGGTNQLDYMHARYYSAISGRFLSVDPGDYDPSQPQSWNRYAYASNSPINRVDPDGKEDDTWSQKLASKVEAAGQAVKRYGASLNDGGVVGIVADATLGTTGDILGGSGDMLRVGTATGEAIGSGGDSYDMAMAVSKDVGRGSALALTLAAPASSVESRLSTTVVHFTDDAGKAAIIRSGSLRAGTFVTTPNEVQGLNAAQVESRLEIAAGRGQNSFTLRVPTRQLAVPANGPETSGGAWQRVLTGQCSVKNALISSH